jgi:hypothetical protein
MPGLIENHDDLTGAVQQVSLPFFHAQRSCHVAPTGCLQTISGLSSNQIHAAESLPEASKLDLDLDIAAKKACPRGSEGWMINGLD